jgi:hypothetical protein
VGSHLLVVTISPLLALQYRRVQGHIVAFIVAVRLAPVANVRLDSRRASG